MSRTMSCRPMKTLEDLTTLKAKECGGPNPRARAGQGTRSGDGNNA